MNIFKIPVWVLICLGIVLGSILIVNIIFSIIRKIFHVKYLKKHHYFAALIIEVFGVLYSVVLGFTIVNSQQNLNNIILQIDEEAYLSESLFQAAKDFPQKERITIQKNVMAYMKSIIEEEWPLMDKKIESPYTLMKLEKMWDSFFQFKPQTAQEKLWYSEAIKILLKQSSARLKRIYASWESIGMLFWVELIIGGILLISFLFFFGAENTIAHRLLISFFTGFFAFTFFVIYSLDHPFSGPIKIEPKAYQVIYNYDVKTHGTSISPEKLKSNLYIPQKK